MNVTVEFKKGKLTETDCFENITERGLKLKIDRMVRRGYTYIILSLLLLLALPLSAQSQTFEQYKRRTEITLGTLNLAFMAYSTSKQHFLPIQTQKWLNWCVATPVVGFTIYTGIDFRRRQIRHEEKLRRLEQQKIKQK